MPSKPMGTICLSLVDIPVNTSLANYVNNTGSRHPLIWKFTTQASTTMMKIAIPMTISDSNLLCSWLIEIGCNGTFICVAPRAYAIVTILKLVVL